MNKYKLFCIKLLLLLILSICLKKKIIIIIVNNNNIGQEKSNSNSKQRIYIITKLFKKYIFYIFEKPTGFSYQLNQSNIEKFISVI